MATVDRCLLTVDENENEDENEDYHPEADC
jgi:hypothetical protein